MIRREIIAMKCIMMFIGMFYCMDISIRFLNDDFLYEIILMIDSDFFSI